VFRLVQLSEIHFGPYLGAADLRRAVSMANELRPHLALVTGDFITNAGDPLEKCLEVLSELKADAGVRGCMGNHEIHARSERFTQEFGRALGMDFLRDSAEPLRFGDATLNLAGVDYQRKGRPYLDGAEKLLRPGALNILLSHNPDVFPDAEKLGYDLVIGGHTHGGQVTVEIVEQWVNAGLFFTPYVAGEYRRGKSVLYVSRGIGTVNLPMRVGALPEITLLRLRRT
jgi:predicted MPP superfamily phosphohydrolase